MGFMYYVLINIRKRNLVYLFCVVYIESPIHILLVVNISMHMEDSIN